MCTRRLTMPQRRARCQRQLFEEPPAVPAIRLPLDGQEQLRRALGRWMRALAKMIREEAHDAATPSKMPTTTLRGTARRSRDTASTGRATAATPGAGAVDAGAGQDDPRGGRP